MQQVLKMFNIKSETKAEFPTSFLKSTTGTSVGFTGSGLTANKKGKVVYANNL